MSSFSRHLVIPQYFYFVYRDKVFTNTAHPYDNIMSLINKACFLDPRFKALVFMADSDKSCTISLVKEEAQIQNDDSTSFNHIQECALA